MQAVLLTPTRVLPQIERVGLTGQTAMTGEETRQRETFAVAEQRLDVHHDLCRG